MQESSDIAFSPHPSNALELFPFHSEPPSIGSIDIECAHETTESLQFIDPVDSELGSTYRSTYRPAPLDANCTAICGETWECLERGTSGPYKPISPTYYCVVYLGSEW